MTNTELRRTIRAFKGTIYATVSGNNDVFYVKVVKSDLLAAIANIVDGELEARVTKGDLYIDSAIDDKE